MDHKLEMELRQTISEILQGLIWTLGFGIVLGIFIMILK